MILAEITLFGFIDLILFFISLQEWKLVLFCPASHSYQELSQYYLKLHSKNPNAVVVTVFKPLGPRGSAPFSYSLY